MNDSLRRERSKNLSHELPLSEIPYPYRNLVTRDRFPKTNPFMQIRHFKKRFYIFLSTQPPPQIIVHHCHVMTASGKMHCRRPAEIAIAS
jgi:hypothetical protein